MKFTRSQKDPKKTPEEEYAEQISTLTESELRDLHKDVKIDHYGNSTAAVINSAAGVGLLSMRSTTRRYRTECMQIEVMEDRMKENGWTPHPNRYRDAVPIALGVAAGTTSGMSFGLINVEKSAKRTKEYVKKKDLFKTKELVENEDINAETEKNDMVEEPEAGEFPVECTQSLENTAKPVVSQHSIVRKPVPAPAATTTELETPQPEGFGIVVERYTVNEDASVVATEPIVIETHAPSIDAQPPTDPKTTKKASLFSPVSVMNKKILGFNFKKDKEENAPTVSVTEIACDVQSPEVNTNAVASHGAIEQLGSPPMYISEAKECVA